MTGDESRYVACRASISDRSRVTATGQGSRSIVRIEARALSEVLWNVCFDDEFVIFKSFYDNLTFTQ